MDFCCAAVILRSLFPDEQRSDEVQVFLLGPRPSPSWTGLSPLCVSEQGRQSRFYHSNKKKKGESTIVPSIIIRSLCLCLWKLSLLHYITPTPKQCICNANQPLSCICTTVITWKNLFNIRRLSGADEWLRHDIHGIEIQLKTASGTEVVVIVQHVPWGLCWNTAISCTGWEILFSFMTIC